MAKENLKSLITSFTPKGDYCAILSPDGIVKLWNTSDGSLLAEWKHADSVTDFSFSCMACGFVGKKRRKEQGICLIALGTTIGDVLAINAFTSEVKWKSIGCQPGGIASLSFANQGHLHVVGTNGMVSEMNSETGELVREMKITKKSISSSACSFDEKIVAAAGAKIQLKSLQNGKELLKFYSNLGPVQYISLSDDAIFIVTSGFGEKHLQVWMCDLGNKTVNNGPVLSMRHAPVALECKNGCNGLVVLSVSESGVAYVWNLKTVSEQDTNPTKITVKANKDKTDPHASGRTRKSRTTIIAARLHSLEKDGRVRALIVYGSTDSPQFSVVDITSPGEDIIIAAGNETVKAVNTDQENGVPSGRGLPDMELEAVAGSIKKEKTNKKRAASDPDFSKTGDLIDNGHGEPTNGVEIDYDINEPTMGEKLASLNLIANNEVKGIENLGPSPQTKPPSADSVHVLLKQALHADDRALLLDCLYRQDEKVIRNSVALLNSSHVLKLLEFLISIIQSRGAILACALPWLRSLLLQHASGIMSQESSLQALNSFYQLIESRVLTFHPALQLSSCLDLLYAGTVDDEADENDTITPAIYEDNGESDVEGSEDAMETDTDQHSQEVETFSDVEGIDVMSD
ncbi:unnamed protein product [Ilex paraguariensis]|uniref:Small-subunit processome Utp12 domain-containing protein n=1 Tax=Ilex paraguariensis TaxID=185542 RepID=A0ABC8TBI2_9AQUA